MNDSISRQDAIRLAEQGQIQGFEWQFKKLCELPSAEPKQKKGKWIDKSGGIEGAWNYCSVCGEQAVDLYDFCPNCGADMKKREGNNV